jgi:hypothetical protein
MLAVEKEYWNCDVRMSKEGLSNLLYTVIMLKGAVTDTFALGCYNFTRKQNAYNYVELCICLPKGQKKKFEEMTGLVLREPVKVCLN